MQPPAVPQGQTTARREPRPWRARGTALLISIVLPAVLLACPGSSRDAEEAASMPEERYLAAWGAYRLTVSDFRRAAQWRAASSGVRMTTFRERLLELDDDDLDSVLRDILQRGFLLHESRNVTLPEDPLVLAAEQDALVQEAPGLNAFYRTDRSGLQDTLDALQIDDQDAEDFAHAILRTRFWPPLPATATTEEALREAWRQDHMRAHVVIATFPNDPTTEAVNTTMRSRQDDIRAYYEQHRDTRFTEPLRVRVHAIRFPVAEGDTAQREEARARATAVRELVTAENFLELAEAHAFEADGVGTGDLDWREPRYVQGLPRIDVGEITPVIELPDAFVIYHLVDLREPEARPLDRSLERAIASSLLREAGPVPEADALIQQLRQRRFTDIDGFAEAAQELGFRTRQPPPFRQSREGFVPGIGNARDLSRAIFDPGLDAPALADGIHHTPGWLHLAFVASRITPESERYDEQAEDFALEHELRTRAELRQARLDEVAERFAPIIDHDALTTLVRQDIQRARPAAPDAPQEPANADGDAP